MNINIKSSKGMSLSTIIVSIILMIIILSSIILSVNKTSETKDAMQLNNDIEELTRKVNLYYSQNGTIPIDESNVLYEEVAYIDENGFDVKANYYRLLISTFDNLSLTNKEKNITKDGKEILSKCYVINKETHLIYYLEYIKTENGKLIYKPIEYKYLEGYDNFVKEAKKTINNKVISEKTINIKSSFKVGDYVNYVYDAKPSGYTLDTTKVASNYSNLYGSESTNITQMNNLTWRILNVDKTNKKILIIACPPQKNIDKNSNCKITMNAQQGLTNGVFVLNDICEKLYSSDNENYKLKARSVNIDDINNVSNLNIYDYIEEATIESVELPEILSFDINESGYNSISDVKKIYFDKLKLYTNSVVQYYSFVNTKNDFDNLIKEILKINAQTYGNSSSLWVIASRISRRTTGTTTYYSSGFFMGNPNGVTIQNIHNNNKSSGADGLGGTIAANVRPVIEISLNEYKLVDKEDAIEDSHITPDTAWDIRKRK